MWSSQRRFLLPVPWRRPALAGLTAVLAGVFMSRPWDASPLRSLAWKFPAGLAVAVFLLWAVAPDWVRRLLSRGRGGREGGVKEEKRTRVAVPMILFMVAFATSLLFVRAFPLPEVQNDAVEYLSLARNISEGRGFTTDSATPAVYRPPLFPFLLGGWYRLTESSSTVSAAAFQSLLPRRGCGGVPSVLRDCPVPRVGGFRRPLAGVQPAAGDPRGLRPSGTDDPAVHHPRRVALGSRCIRAPSTLRAGLAGAAWGLCTLTKVVAWFVPFLLLAMSFLPDRLRVEWGKKEAAALVLCFAAVIAPTRDLHAASTGSSR